MIRWEEDFEDEFGRDLTGYLGKAEIAAIVGDRFCGEYYLTFVRDRNRRYLSLSSAKRGAERMLAKFLRDAELVPAREAIRIKPAKNTAGVDLSLPGYRRNR